MGRLRVGAQRSLSFDASCILWQLDAPCVVASLRRSWRRRWRIAPLLTPPPPPPLPPPPSPLPLLLLSEKPADPHRERCTHPTPAPKPSVQAAPPASTPKLLLKLPGWLRTVITITKWTQAPWKTPQRPPVLQGAAPRRGGGRSACGAMGGELFIGLFPVWRDPARLPQSFASGCCAWTCQPLFCLRDRPAAGPISLLLHHPWRQRFLSKDALTSQICNFRSHFWSHSYYNFIYSASLMLHNSIKIHLFITLPLLITH